MPQPSHSSILSQLVADSPLIQDANFRPNQVDRNYIDEQVRGVQTLVVEGLTGGLHCTWFRLSGSSEAVATGDVVCSSPETSGDGVAIVTKALASQLAAAGGAVGVVVEAAAPSARVKVAISGVVPPSITGLAATPGVARVSTAARCEQVGAWGTSDAPLGPIDWNGNLTLTALPVLSSLPSTGGGGTAVTYTLAGTSAALSSGDLFCSDSNTNPALVTKATPAAIATAGVVLGIAAGAVSPGASFSTGLVSGSFVAASITGLSAGVASVVVANSSGRCARISAPDGSEHFLGTCDTQGNVTFLPRSSPSTNPLHVFNVKSYGAVGDFNGTTGTDDTPAFYRCQEALRQSGVSGAIFFIPPGAYYMADNFEVCTPSKYLGVGTAGGNGGSQIYMAPGKSWRICGAQANKTLGRADECEVQGLDFYRVALFIPTWKPNDTIARGDIRGLRMFDPARYASIGGDKNPLVYFEALTSGTTGRGVRSLGSTVHAGVSTTVATGFSAPLSGATITVVDTTAFASTGTLYVQNAAGNQIQITYTGKTSNTFTGCTVGGVGPVSVGAEVWAQDGVTLPAAKIFARSGGYINYSGAGVNYPNAFPTSGTLIVQTTAGPQTVTYTGIGDPDGNGFNSFTGCSGGTGTIKRGACIYAPANTTISGSSFSLPAASITVVDASLFPNSGIMMVVSGTGASAVPQPVAYTGKSGNTFTGCTGGVAGLGVVQSGAAVYVEPQWPNQNICNPDFLDVYDATNGKVRFHTIVRPSDGAGHVRPGFERYGFMAWGGGSLSLTSFLNASNPEPSWNFSNGQFTTDAQGFFWQCFDLLDGNIVFDGDVCWRVLAQPLIFALTQCTIDRCNFGSLVDPVTGNTGGGVGIFAVGNLPTIGAPDMSGMRVGNCSFGSLDVSTAVIGGDAQGSTFTACRTFGIGKAPTASFGHPSGAPNPSYAPELFAPRYGYYDVSLGGNTYISPYAEGSAPAIGFVSTTGASTRVGGYSENANNIPAIRDVFLGASCFFGGNGGAGVPQNLPSFSSQGAYNVRTILRHSFGQGDKDQNSSLAHGTGTGGNNQYLFSFGVDEDGQESSPQWFWRYDYPKTGWFGWWYQQQIEEGPIAFSNRFAGGSAQNSSVGKLWLPQGCFIGQDTSTGDTSAYLFPDTSAWETNTIRGGHRIPGDVYFAVESAVTNAVYAKLVVTAGWHGPVWFSGRFVQKASTTTPWRAGTIVRPTSTTNTKRFVCINDGTGNGTDVGTEPNWSTAITIGDTVNSPNGNGIVYQYIGDEPILTDLWVANDPELAHTSQRDHAWTDTVGTPSDATAPKASVFSYRRTVQTTTNASNQALADITLPNNATSVVDILLTGKKAGTTESCSIKMSGTFYRDSGGNAVRVGTDDNTTKNTSGLAATGSIVIGTSGDIKPSVTPPSAIDINWTAIVQVSSGTD